MIKREEGKYENESGRIFDTYEEYNAWFIEVAEKYEPLEEFSKEEEAYRRGYSQGFFAACCNPDVKHCEVQEWRYHGGLTHPPGSICEGKKYEKTPSIENLMDTMEVID